MLYSSSHCMGQKIPFSVSHWGSIVKDGPFLYVWNVQIALFWVWRNSMGNRALRNASLELGVSSSASVRRRNGQNKETEESFFCLLATNLLLRGGKKPLKYQMYSVWLPQSLHLVFSCKLNWLNFNLDRSYKKMSKEYCYESWWDSLSGIRVKTGVNWCRRYSVMLQRGLWRNQSWS